MEEILQKNIASHLKTQGIRLSELSRRSRVAYTTLQGIMAKDSANDAQISTVAKIADGLGVGIGTLLEYPGWVQPPDPLAALEIVRRALADSHSLPPVVAIRIARIIRVCSDKASLARFDQFLNTLDGGSLPKSPGQVEEPDGSGL